MRHQHERYRAAAGERRIQGSHQRRPAYEAFVAELTDLCTDLAHNIVRDGEGATKFITVRVTGAPDEAAAHAVANTIAISPLVKTAFYGGDANWAAS